MYTVHIHLVVIVIFNWLSVVLVGLQPYNPTRTTDCTINTAQTCTGWLMKFTEDKWCIKLVFFTWVLYLLKKFQALLQFQAQNFIQYKVMICYVTSSKKYVDFASNAATRLSYYSYMFQSTFTLPSCWCLKSQLYYQDTPRENNPKFYVLLNASRYNSVKKNQPDAQLILSIFCQYVTYHSFYERINSFLLCDTESTAIFDNSCDTAHPIIWQSVHVGCTMIHYGRLEGATLRQVQYGKREMRCRMGRQDMLVLWLHRDRSATRISQWQRCDTYCKALPIREKIYIASPVP
jgi:hypothetical protein